MARFFDKYRPYQNESDESDVEEVDVDKLPPIQLASHEHKLQYTYCLWYHRGSHKIKTATDYSKSLHLVGRCASVEQWWGLYCRLLRPSQLKPYRELHLFKSGIKPMWEDPSNSRGGKWVIRLRKNKIDRAWENVCMAMLGEQFLVGQEICGIVLATRFPEDLLCLWNRNAVDQNCVNRIRDALRRILNLSANTPMEYKAHCDSLKYIRNLTQNPTGTSPPDTNSSNTTGETTAKLKPSSPPIPPPMTRSLSSTFPKPLFRSDGAAAAARLSSPFSSSSTTSSASGQAAANAFSQPFASSSFRSTRPRFVGPSGLTRSTSYQPPPSSSTSSSATPATFASKTSSFSRS